MLRLFRFWRRSGRDLRLLFHALSHPARPLWLWPFVIALGLYAVDPLNLGIPVLGAVDELIVVPLILRAMLTLLPAGIRASFERRTT
jgi:uncharacterized membrane protein YkvA (DUF1232 family)